MLQTKFQLSALVLCQIRSGRADDDVKVIKDVQILTQIKIQLKAVAFSGVKRHLVFSRIPSQLRDKTPNRTFAEQVVIHRVKIEGETCPCGKVG